MRPKVKPIWIRVEFSGCDGIPPLGEIIRGSELGILVAVEVGLLELSSLAPLAVVATAILEATESDLAESVPVGLML